MGDIKNFGPRKRKKRGDPIQGYYKVLNPNKYIGDLSKIIYRSSWEKSFMRRMDLSVNVIKWSSEPVAIPYISPLDNRTRKYNVDFYVEMLVFVDGVKVSKKYLVEVKPKKDYFKKPVFTAKVKTMKAIQQYNKRLSTWLVNHAKFKAAEIYALNRGMEFKIFDETNL